jgi:hypothetical protein
MMPNEQPQKYPIAAIRPTIQLSFHVATPKPNNTSKMTNENMGAHRPLTGEKYSRATRRGISIEPKIVWITSRPSRGRISWATIDRSGANGPRLPAEDGVDMAQLRSGGSDYGSQPLYIDIIISLSSMS